jgi:phosphoribosylformylglycinamidine cyclo-ligase
MTPSKPATPTYSSSGVDYELIDAGKRHTLTEALATSALLAAQGGKAFDASRGEPAFVFSVGDMTLAFVLEGLGTKSMIARLVEEELGESYYDHVAYDTVAAIVNDLCCVGASPLVVNAYFATGTSDWYAHRERHTALLGGWRRACVDAGAVWGGGESPTLPELVHEGEIELAGSAIGVVPTGRTPILGDQLTAGDEIVFIASTGLHANGASLARLLADKQRMPQGYATLLPSGRKLGQALLDPSMMYAKLTRELVSSDLPLHYFSHITGHGMLKLMRPAYEFTYEINQLPDVPEVLEFLVEAAEMSQFNAYQTFNMGCGFAIYCGAGAGSEVVAVAENFGYTAQVAGTVKKGPRRVQLKPIDVVYESTAMDLTPRRAA